MFCFDNKIISGIKKNNDGSRLKNSIFNTLPGVKVVDRATTYCLPLHYIYLGCSPGCLPCQQISRKTSKLSEYFKREKYYVRYNNRTCF